MAGDNVPDEEFWDVADTFIHLANDHAEEISASKVSAAMLYAAARYNAFVAVADGGARGAPPEDQAIEYFVDQYRRMLAENLDDYRENPP